MFFTMPTNLAR